MRKVKVFGGKRHSYDSEKAEALGKREFSYYGDPAGYEEALYKTKGGLYFVVGQGGADSPYADGADIRPLTDEEAQAWLAEA